VVDLVTRRMAAEQAGSTDPAALAGRARLIALLSIAAMRHAWITWMDDNGEHGTLQARLLESFEAMPGIVGASA
jgi:hypothetical protein